MKRNLLTFAWIIWTAHCGGSTAPRESNGPGGAADAGDGAVNGGMNLGNADVQGTAGGKAFSPHGAIGVIIQPPTSIPNFVRIEVPANFSLTCDQFKQDSVMIATHPNEAVLLIDVSAGSTPLVPGTYAVTSTSTDAGEMTVSGLYNTTDSNCRSTFEESSTGGSVTVTAVDTTAISGNFHLTFPDGDALDGEFSAPFCYAFFPQPGIRPPTPICVTAAKPAGSAGH